jgi:transcriptional regulator with XRE-family HTH domain
MTPELFREARIKLGYSIEKWADRLGLSIRTIYYYESGEVPIPRTVSLLISSIKLEEE